MFENLTEKLTSVFSRLSNKGRITESDLDTALREVRLALLEADVNFQVVREFIASIKDQVLGSDVLKGVSPGQQVIKAVHEELIRLLGQNETPLVASSSDTTVIMLVGLNGAGKTTTTAKLALHLSESGKVVEMVGADLRRPAAMEQLSLLGKQINVPVYIDRNAKEDQAIVVAASGVEKAKSRKAAWVLVDTGGRMQEDVELMRELADMKQALKPQEILMVIDAMTGQDAVNSAGEFHRYLGLTGLILSKLDGDARGGAAMTASYITGVPVKYSGTGEKMDGLEVFHPERIASRILGMGDVLSLVEKVRKEVSEADARELARKIRKSQFDLNDFLTQLQQVQKMGSVDSILGMLPRNMRNQFASAQIDDSKLKLQEAIISSMTLEERTSPEILNGSRRRRVAFGSGVTVQEVNQLLNQYRQAQKLMKQLAGGKSPWAVGKNLLGL